MAGVLYSINGFITIWLFLRSVHSSNFQRTIVFVRVETKLGENVFLRGGRNGSCSMDAQKDPCAIPISHRLVNTTPSTSAVHQWAKGDNFVDWHGAEMNQGQYRNQKATGTPMIWTTSEHIPRGPVVTEDGYGYTSINKYGAHFWLLDVDMDCSKTDRGWFQFKVYVSPLRGWESDILQSSACGGESTHKAPYTGNNHIAVCGKFNMFYYDNGGCFIDSIAAALEQRPNAYRCGAVSKSHRDSLNNLKINLAKRENEEVAIPGQKTKGGSLGLATEDSAYQWKQRKSFNLFRRHLEAMDDIDKNNFLMDVDFTKKLFLPKKYYQKRFAPGRSESLNQESVGLLSEKRLTSVDFNGRFQEPPFNQEGKFSAVESEFQAEYANIKNSLSADEGKIEKYSELKTRVANTEANKQLPKVTGDLRFHDSETEKSLKVNNVGNEQLTYNSTSFSSRWNHSRVLSSRIMHGYPATEGRWPWMAEILYKGHHGCGAVLISPYWVLTAGHCVRTATRYGVWGLIVRFGELDRARLSGHERDYFVKRIVKHPLSDKVDTGSDVDNDNDIALLELVYPVYGVTGLSPVCLPHQRTTDQFVGRECWAIGWGKTDGNDPSHLQEVKMTVHSSKQCSHDYGSRVSSRQLCAGGGLISACSGDSGSPLSCSVDGRWFVAGIVSWGENYCTGRPSIYTRISAHLDWIKQHIGIGELHTPSVIG